MTPKPGAEKWLRGCPFCGHEPSLVQGNDDRYRVECGYCQAQQYPRRHEDQAKSDWNQRSPSPDAPAEYLELTCSSCAATMLHKRTGQRITVFHACTPMKVRDLCDTLRAENEKLRQQLAEAVADRERLAKGLISIVDIGFSSENNYSVAWQLATDTLDEVDAARSAARKEAA